jgi:hypothetical protein
MLLYIDACYYVKGKNIPLPLHPALHYVCPLIKKMLYYLPLPIRKNYQECKIKIYQRGNEHQLTLIRSEELHVSINT